MPVAICIFAPAEPMGTAPGTSNATAPLVVSELLAVILLIAPQLLWPMAIAILISLARMAATTESVTTARRHRRT